MTLHHAPVIYYDSTKKRTNVSLGIITMVMCVTWEAHVHSEDLETPSGLSSWFSPPILRLGTQLWSSGSRQALWLLSYSAVPLLCFETGSCYVSHTAPDLRILLASVYQVRELWVGTHRYAWLQLIFLDPYCVPEFSHKCIFEFNIGPMR